MTTTTTTTTTTTKLGNTSGHVTGTNTRTREVTVQIDEGQALPKLGQHLLLTHVLEDEEVGRRLRTMFLGLDQDGRDSAREMASEIGNSLGWPVLEDLLKELLS